MSAKIYRIFDRSAVPLQVKGMEVGGETTGSVEVQRPTMHNEQEGQPKDKSEMKV